MFTPAIRPAYFAVFAFVMACTNGGLVGEGRFDAGASPSDGNPFTTERDARASDGNLFDTMSADAGTDAGNDGGDNGSVVRGTVHVDSFPESDVQLSLEWGVSATSPDYAVIQPGGRVDGATFEFALPMEAPPDGLNTSPDGRAALGVAFILAYEADYALPQGRVDGGDGFSVHSEDAVGIVPQAIIVRQGSVEDFADWPPGLLWILDFPEGISCGAGVFSDNVDVNDRFEPTPCTDLDLFGTGATELRVPDWT